DDVKAAWDGSGHDKGRVFDRLRALCPLPADTDLSTFLASIFAAGSDDLWLAQTIQKHGPEPLWPAAELDERGKRAAAGKWPEEPGNIAASLGKTKGGRDVSAYYFRGQTDERAMIIAGVHGTEQSGVEVVEMLRTALTTGPRPYYTVIIVPRVFPDNVAKGIREGATPTNRNFPKPGESLSTATTAGGAKGPVDAQGKPILPENVMLMQLIERFRPTRIASVHATWDKPKAGIFSDPHTVSAAAKAKAGKAGEAALIAAADKKTKDDEALAIKMATEADKQGAKVPGNKLSSGTPNPGWQAPTPGGTSMGGWGPSDVTEGKPSDRGSMTVITVEVSGDEDSSKSAGAAAKAARIKEFEALRDVLRDIFLGPP
ncbi:MAG TPA: hypothetical protein VJT67_13160, partial [Longimicrobiaceae bacterium]|nr:hypothetical protein [Longimicrobiaceae bacterium]